MSSSVLGLVFASVMAATASTLQRRRWCSVFLRSIPPLTTPVVFSFNHSSSSALRVLAPRFPLLLHVLYSLPHFRPFLDIADVVIALCITPSVTRCFNQSKVRAAGAIFGDTSKRFFKVTQLHWAASNVLNNYHTTDELSDKRAGGTTTCTWNPEKNGSRGREGEGKRASFTWCLCLPNAEQRV